jgi:hypothetical protein
MKTENQKPLPGHRRTTEVPKRSKGKRPRKPVGLQVPETKQHEIAMRRAAGESKTALAKSLRMARKTVNRVLSHGEYQLLIQRCRSQLVGLLPRAARVVERLLQQKRVTNKQVDVMIAVLTGLQLFIRAAAPTSLQHIQMNLKAGRRNRFSKTFTRGRSPQRRSSDLLDRPMQDFTGPFRVAGFQRRTQERRDVQSLISEMGSFQRISGCYLSSLFMRV